MDKSQCFELGYIERSHGLDGSVLAVFDVDQPSRYRKIDAIFLEKSSQLIPFLIKGIKPTSGNRMVIRLDGINDDTQAQSLKGSTLFLPESALPSLKSGQFYFHELVGASVEDKNLGKLGVISSIYEYPQQTIIGMEWQGSEVLIPMHDAIIQKFDRQSKTVKTELPDGLLDVYLQSSEPEAL